MGLPEKINTDEWLQHDVGYWIRKNIAKTNEIIDFLADLDERVKRMEENKKTCLNCGTDQYDEKCLGVGGCSGWTPIKEPAKKIDDQQKELERVKDGVRKITFAMKNSHDHYYKDVVADLEKLLEDK